MVKDYSGNVTSSNKKHKLSKSRKIFFHFFSSRRLITCWHRGKMQLNKRQSQYIFCRLVCVGRNELYILCTFSFFFFHFTSMTCLYSVGLLFLLRNLMYCLLLGCWSEVWTVIDGGDVHFMMHKKPVRYSLCFWSMLWVFLFLFLHHPYVHFNQSELFVAASTRVFFPAIANPKFSCIWQKQSRGFKFTSMEVACKLWLGRQYFFSGFFFHAKGHKFRA